MKHVIPGANIAHAAVLIDVPEKMSRKHMLRPKPTRDRTPYIPVMPTDELSWLLGGLMPEERQAMAHICENASILGVEDVEHTYLVVPVTETVLDTLATFGADSEDREIEQDHEIEVDGSEDDDKEPDVDDQEDYDNERGWHRLSRRPSHRRPDPMWSSGNQLVPVRDYRRDGTAAPNVLGHKLRRDVPDTDMKAGDTIFANAKPGWSGKGVYMMQIDLGPSEGWRIVAVGLIDPLTKKGKLRRSLVIGNIRFDLEGSDYRAHRVKSWGHPV